MIVRVNLTCPLCRAAVMMTMEAPALRVLPPPLSPPLFAPGLEPLLTGCNATRQEEVMLSGQVEVWEAVVVENLP